MLSDNCLSVWRSSSCWWISMKFSLCGGILNSILVPGLGVWSLDNQSGNRSRTCFPRRGISCFCSLESALLLAVGSFTPHPCPAIHTPEHHCLSSQGLYLYGGVSASLKGVCGWYILKILVCIFKNMKLVKAYHMITPASKLWHVVKLQGVEKMQRPLENSRPPKRSPSFLLKSRCFLLRPHEGVCGFFLISFTVGVDKIVSLVFSWNSQSLLINIFM